MSSPDPATYGILGGVGFLALAVSKAFSRVFRLSNSTLEKDLKRIMVERDKERDEKHSERSKRVTAELALHIATLDFDRFLTKKGIDPAEFTVSLDKAKAVQEKYRTDRD